MSALCVTDTEEDCILPESCMGSKMDCRETVCT